MLTPELLYKGFSKSSELYSVSDKTVVGARSQVTTPEWISPVNLLAA